MGNIDVMRSSVVRDLRSHIDDKLSMNSHINKICNESFYYMFYLLYLIHRKNKCLSLLLPFFQKNICTSCIVKYRKVAKNSFQRLDFDGSL